MRPQRHSLHLAHVPKKSEETEAGRQGSIIVTVEAHIARTHQLAGRATTQSLADNLNGKSKRHASYTTLWRLEVAVACNDKGCSVLRLSKMSIQQR